MPGERSPYDSDAGILRVQSVTVDIAGVVVDCGGYVVPDGHTLASDADPVKSRPRSFLSRVLGHGR